MNKVKLSIIAVFAVLAATSQAEMITDGDFSLTPVATPGFNQTTGTWLWDGAEVAPRVDIDSRWGGGTDHYASARSLEYGAIFQTTSEPIVSGENYTLTATAFNTYNVNRGNAVIAARLYYMDGVTRTYIPGAEDSYTGSASTEWTTTDSTMSISYTGAGAAVGNNLGVEFSWEGGTANGSWIGLDKVSVIPEPATLGMVAAFGGAILFIRRKLMI